MAEMPERVAQRDHSVDRTISDRRQLRRCPSREEPDVETQYGRTASLQISVVGYASARVIQCGAAPSPSLRRLVRGTR